MEILPAPVSCLPASMSVKDGKESLAVHPIIVEHVRVRVFRCPPGTLFVQHAKPKSRLGKRPEIWRLPGA